MVAANSFLEGSVPKNQGVVSKDEKPTILTLCVESVPSGFRHCFGPAMPPPGDLHYAPREEVAHFPCSGRNS